MTRSSVGTAVVSLEATIRGHRLVHATILPCPVQARDSLDRAVKVVAMGKVEGLVALEEPAVESFDGVCQLYVDDFDDRCYEHA